MGHIECIIYIYIFIYTYVYGTYRMYYIYIHICIYIYIICVVYFQGVDKCSSCVSLIPRQVWPASSRSCSQRCRRRTRLHLLLGRSVQVPLVAYYPAVTNPAGLYIYIVYIKRTNPATMANISSSSI